MGEQRAPRLELTWPNKDKFLLVPKDDDGKPIWVDRDHPAAHEVRLSTFTNAVGEVGDDPHADNLLFTGDSLDVLRILRDVPEYAAHYRGRVKLIYIDPPFNTGQTFTHYDDWMEHSTWLSFMRDRLLLMKDLLAPDGTLWLHLDNYEAHRMRCLLDEVLGADQYLNTVVWKRTGAKSAARRGMGTMYDNIIVFGRSEAARLSSVLQPYSEEYLRTKYAYEDSRGRYRLGPLLASGVRNGDSGRPWQGIDPSEKGTHWRAPGAAAVLGPAAADMTTRQKLDALLAAGYIQVSAKAGGTPQSKIYLRSDGGVALGDFWADINVINSQGRERVGYDTQKPEELIARVLTMATNPGDILLDCFAGSGTTAAVAHKMGRRWVACDVLHTTIQSFTEPRLTGVVRGEDSGGITASAAWTSGGGFRTVVVEPSLYELGPGGLVLLREGISDNDLARAMCGQLGFTHTPGDAPFAGRRGRMRLAVLDGFVGSEEARHLVSLLGDGERVTIAATAVLPGVEDLLTELARGSRVRKIPRDVLREVPRHRSILSEGVLR